MNNNFSILLDYDKGQMIYQSMLRKMQDLLIDLCDSNKIAIHSITGRVKTKESLNGKLEAKNKYSDISQITDVIGLRIITKLKDDVDIVADLVRKEFDVDLENSVDKRNKKFDEFGYMSLHYVVKLSLVRRNLPEYVTFKGISFEIQIRSILQHAWAEIEHDVGYKNTEEVPDFVRRDFARIAALLETADIEFARLSSNLLIYRSGIDEEILLRPETVELNRESIEAFYRINSIIRRLDNEIVDAVHSQIGSQFYTDQEDIQSLTFIGIKNILQLNHYLNDRSIDVVRFAVIFMSDHNHEGAYTIPGISLTYLVYLLVAEKGNPELLQQYLEKFKGRWVQYMTERLQWSSRILKEGGEIPEYDPRNFEHAIWPRK